MQAPHAPQRRWSLPAANRCRRLILSLALCSLSQCAPADANGGQWAHVERVVDGDTIIVQTGAARRRVRLRGIDAPESVHPERAVEFFGREASTFLKQMLEGQRVELLTNTSTDTEAADTYGRLLAEVRRQDGVSVNEMLLRQGYARIYRNYKGPGVQRFRAAEKEARSAKRGLWGARSAGKRILGNKRSRIYHLPSDRHYGTVSERNLVIFATEAEAKAAGYRRAHR